MKTFLKFCNMRTWACFNFWTADGLEKWKQSGEWDTYYIYYTSRYLESKYVMMITSFVAIAPFHPRFRITFSFTILTIVWPFVTVMKILETGRPLHHKSLLFSYCKTSRWVLRLWLLWIVLFTLIRSVL